MKTRHFLSQLEDHEITAAIAQAEKKTSGEIRVFISHRHCGDPMSVARRHFHRLGMTKTRHRNAILIFVAPKSQTFALLGDQGIHEKCGDDFWQALRDEMTAHYQSGRYTAGLVHAIRKAGELLAAHFPADPGDNPDELPNTVEQD